MTAITATRPEPGTPTPQAAPRRRRRRWLIAVSAVAVAVAVAVAAVALTRPAASPSAHDDAELASADRGTYRLDDGQHLTLFGSASTPSYELAGTVTGLMAEGADRFVGMGGVQALSVARDDSGAAVGVTLERPGEPPRLASAVPLHREQEVRIASDGAALAGTLLLPPGPGPHPAVVLVHGAGPQHRHGTFRLLGSHLARRGVATLVYDKRGVGDSTGDYAAATFEDLAADALAGVGLLAGHPAIDPDRVGVAGFSQGGWVVAEAARRADDVAFVVALSPSGFTPGDQQAWLHGSMLAARGLEGPAMVVADRVSRMLYSSVDLVEAGLMPRVPHVPGFWFHALDPHHDTAGLWEGVRQPALLVWGALDCQVPAHDSMEALVGALRRGGNDSVTTTVLADADHSLVRHGPCEMETSGHHGSYTYADGALTVTADWVRALADVPEGTALPVAPRPDPDVLGWHIGPPAPAPWYGTLLAQVAAVLLLGGLFGVAAARWAVAVTRSATGGRRPLGRGVHLPGVTGLAGLAATATGVAAFAEVAVLGAVHASPLVGGPAVGGAPVLMTAARVLVALTAVLGASTVAAAFRARRQPARPSRRTALVPSAATALLVVWAVYWVLLPMP